MQLLSIWVLFPPHVIVCMKLIPASDLQKAPHSKINNKLIMFVESWCRKSKLTPFVPVAFFKLKYTSWFSALIANKRCVQINTLLSGSWQMESFRLSSLHFEVSSLSLVTSQFSFEVWCLMKCVNYWLCVWKLLTSEDGRVNCSTNI